MSHQSGSQRGITRLFPAALIVLSVAIAVGAAGVHAQGRESFTRRERNNLNRGELVVRAETRQQGALRLVGGTSFQVVSLPPDIVWQAVQDTGNYREFVPQVAESRVVRGNTGQQLIYLRHQQGPVEASYYMSIEYQQSQRIAQFRLDRTRPHSIREGWGFFIVRPYQGDRTMVTFGLMADVGSGLMSGIVRPRVHEWMMRVPQLLKRWLEGRGQDRYRR